MNDKRYLLDEWVQGRYEIVDGVINVKGNVFIRKWKGDRLPVQFGFVSGVFECFDCQLVSLVGAPKEVGGSFYCYNNKLVTLEGASEKVGGNFNCSDNQLVSLVGAPEEVGGHFYCQNNPFEFY